MKYLPTRYHFHYCEWFGSKRSVISIRFVMSQFLNTWLFVSLVLVIKIAKCGLRKSWKWVSISFFTCIENRPGKCSFLRNPILKVGHSNFWSRRTSQLTFLTTCQMKLWHLSGTFGEKLLCFFSIKKFYHLVLNVNWNDSFFFKISHGVSRPFSNLTDTQILTTNTRVYSDWSSPRNT